MLGMYQYRSHSKFNFTIIKNDIFPLDFMLSSLFKGYIWQMLAFTSSALLSPHSESSLTYWPKC